MLCLPKPPLLLGTGEDGILSPEILGELRDWLLRDLVEIRAAPPLCSPPIMHSLRLGTHSSGSGRALTGLGTTGRVTALCRSLWKTLVAGTLPQYTSAHVSTGQRASAPVRLAGLGLTVTASTPRPRCAPSTAGTSRTGTVRTESG